jgi:DNA polymerase-3 subunit gamma/tau
LSTVVFLPAEVRYKVYVIDEVHMLSTHAFNSLLKTLEEPPSHVVFVLATTEVHKVPATIVSRCQRFDFRRIGLGDLLGLIRGIAEKEGMEAEEEALGFLAEAADGSARDAISLLEQAASYGGNKITLNDVIYIVGSTEENVLGDLVRLAWEGEIQGGLELIDKQMLMGRDAALFLRELAEYLRDCLVVKLGGKGRRYVRENGAGPWLQSVEKGTLISLIEIVGKAAEELRWSSQHRLLCEVAFIRMSEALPGKPELSGPAAEGEVPKESTAGEEPAESGAEQGWRKVIQALEKDKAIPLVQLAEDARPSWDGDGNLVLAFGYQFSKEEFERRLLEEMEDAAYVDKLLLQAFGRRVTVMCRMSGPEVPKSVKAVFPESRLVRGNWG